MRRITTAIGPRLDFYDFFCECFSCRRLRICTLIPYRNAY